MTDKPEPPEEIHMRFASNGNVRKWSFEPFKEAEVKYVREDMAEQYVQEKAMRDLIEQGLTVNRIGYGKDGVEVKRIPPEDLKKEISQEP